jgi:hypothetical protein
MLARNLACLVVTGTLVGLAVYLLLRFSGDVPDRSLLQGRRSARLRGCAVADHPHYAICRWAGKSLQLEEEPLPTTP